MRRGSIGESIFANITASIIPDCTCFHCVTYFSAHRQTGTHRPPPAPLPSLALAGCWVDRVVGTSKQNLVDEGV